MKINSILFIFLIIFSFFALLAQEETKEAKTAEPKDTISKTEKDSEKQRISEIESNLKNQKEQLEELKRLYGIKSTEKKETPEPSGEDNYVSPLKTGGLTADYNKAMFLDPVQVKKFNKNQKPWLNDWIRVGANVRPRYEDRYNLGFDKQNKNYTSRIVQLSQLFFIIDPSPYFSMKVTIQDSRVWGGSTPASVGDRAPYFAGAGNSDTPANSGNVPNETYLREGWFMLKKLPLEGKLQVGRQVISYGDQRMIGGANWNSNGISFDGARLMFDSDKFNFHFLGYKVVGNQPGPNGLLSANASTSYTDPITGKSSVVSPALPNQYLVGTYDTAKFKDWFLLDVYSLGILTQKTPAYSGTTLTNPALTIPATSDSDLYNNSWSKQKNNLWTNGFRITNRTAGNNLSSTSPWQGWDWTMEAAFQSGTTGARVNKNPSLNSALNEVIGQTTGSVTPNYNLLTQNQKYTGQLYVFQTGYTLNEKLRFGAQFMYASGDSNRTDGSTSTFQTLPGPRFSVIPYWNNMAGLSENINTKNLISRTINISYKTEKLGSFYASYFINDKAKTQDSWYAISGAANSGATVEGYTLGQKTITLAKSNRHIYSEFDLTWMYNINDYVSMWIGGGMLTAGDSVKNQKNAAYTYNVQTGTITANNAIYLGQSGAASKGHMFFFQMNAAF